jgi:CYTH domain-containing protein
LEIERKFHVHDPPSDLARHPAEHIEQGYVAVGGDGTEVRVRRRAGRATLTVKRGSGLVREETELPLPKARFDDLWPLTEGRRVEKVRHLVPCDALTVELDVYGGALAGLVVAEIEFDSVEAGQDFQPPAWLGVEVTGDERYANRTLACEGWPSRAPSLPLQSDEVLTAGLRRIARGQLDKAIGAIDASGGDALGDAVHTARKSLKRLRSEVRLARDGLGDETYRRENTTFRDVGRSLSGARDSQVMVETLDDLRERYSGDVPDGGFAALRAALVAEHEAAHRRLRRDATTIGAAVEELRAARARTEAWTLSGDGPEALGRGFRRIYKRGRKAARTARREPGDETLHELRKRVKDLWYAGEIIRPVAPKRAKKVAKAASDLSDVIGLDHDLAVLRETAGRHAAALSGDELGALDELIARRREKLQRKARAGARRLYRRRPGAMVSRLGLDA